jgi:23S rRNA-intervening sequence protein
VTSQSSDTRSITSERLPDDMSADRRPAQSFRDLLVWQKAHRFVLAIYEFTSHLPKQETYGLSIQMRRAAISIPANIAEGFRKRSRPDKARFMNMLKVLWKRVGTI